MADMIVPDPRFYQFKGWKWENTDGVFQFRVDRTTATGQEPKIPTNAYFHGGVRNYPPDSSQATLIAVSIPLTHIVQVNHETSTIATLLCMDVAVRKNSNPAKYVVQVYKWALLQHEDRATMDIWVDVIRAHVFGAARNPLRFFVIINPKAGKGKASDIYLDHVRPFLTAVNANIHNRPDTAQKDQNSSFIVATQHQGHARTLASTIPYPRYDVIVCVGGDGIVHEVINGLAERPDARTVLANLPIAVIPAGSGIISRLIFIKKTKLIRRQRLGRQLIWEVSSNVRGLAGLQMYCRHSCGLLMSVRTMVADLMVAKPIGGGSPVWLFLSVALGWIAYADIHTEKLRFLGDKRFALGIAWKVWKKSKYPCSVATFGHHTPPLAGNAVDAEGHVKNGIETFYKAVHSNDNRPPTFTTAPGNDLTSLVGTNLPMDRWETRTYTDMFSLYAGKLPWTAKDAQAFPTALANDGYIDLCIIEGDISRWQLIKIFDGLEKATHFNHPKVSYMKVKAFKVMPGVSHNGTDFSNIHKDVSDAEDGDPALEAQRVDDLANQPVRLNAHKINSREFRDTFTFSLDGERHDPGHGFTVEVHQGLARLVCNENCKFRETRLINPARPKGPPPPTLTPRPSTAAGADGTAGAVQNLSILRGPQRPDRGPDVGPIDLFPPAADEATHGGAADGAGETANAGGKNRELCVMS